MLASSNVNIGVMAQNNAFLAPETSDSNLRRNYLVLFDSQKNETVKIDCSIGVSLLDREKQDMLKAKGKIKGDLEGCHPYIPNVKMAGQDKGPMHI